MKNNTNRSNANLPDPAPVVDLVFLKGMRIQRISKQTLKRAKFILNISLDISAITFFTVAGFLALYIALKELDYGRVWWSAFLIAAFSFFAVHRIYLVAKRRMREH